MITKEKLLVALNRLIRVEESAVTLYANFSKALVKETPHIEKAEKEKIAKLLSELRRDSARHKEIIDALIEVVSERTKNEY